MNWNKWLRQIHRWVSMAFTAAVIASFVVLGLGRQESAAWVFYLPLPPLFVLLFTGLYLFVLPYGARWRSARR
jgi:hypothetical protein